MSLVRKAAPTFYRYSIDEGFCDLSGMDNYDLKDMSKKKSICTSHSFPGMVTDMDTLRTSISNFAARCAEKLRHHDDSIQLWKYLNR